jgi:uncharacterized protein (TIGR02996 family)
MTDDAAFLRACLDAPGDQAPWLAYSDALEDAGRSDAALLVRHLAPSVTVLPAELPHVWRLFVREMRHKGLTWETLAALAAEALGDAARAAGCRIIPANPTAIVEFLSSTPPAGPEASFTAPDGLTYVGPAAVRAFESWAAGAR